MALASGCGDGTEPEGESPLSPGGKGLAISSVSLPDAPSGDVPITVILRDPRSARFTVSVELSTDEGETFRPARLSGPNTEMPSSPDGVEGIILWDSLADLGFRGTPTVKLRVVASDGARTTAPVTVTTAPISNVRAAARRVDQYMVTYGRITPEVVAIAKTYQMVILNPSQSVTRETILEIQRGIDPANPSDDVLVLGYVSVGEDSRTRRLSDDELRADPRFRGDGTGPRIDPRGPNADGQSLDGIDPRGAPSNGGTGFASYYLDDNSVDRSGTGTGDGFPDRNSIFGGAFVNAGDPAWFEVVDAMSADGPDKVSGLREVLSTDYGRGLGCDGVFLDTIDTAGPNSYTNSASANQSEFEWTAPGFAQFIRRLREKYPTSAILQNRGVFFFDPRRPQFKHSTRGLIDFLLYESYRLDSSSAHQWHPSHYPDNRYNLAPKLMAEANRPDGFRALSLGYAEGPAGEMSSDTLLGTSTIGLESLLEDIRVTQELAGFRHYLTNGAVTLVNSFVREHANIEDQTPPIWTSTYNDKRTSPASEPTPRVGIQQVSPGPAALTVRWDVALDLNRVGYALYLQTTPFDFTADPKLASATRIVLSPHTGHGYQDGVGPDIYANQATVTGLETGRTYYLLIRAFDSSQATNEEDNQVVLTGVPE